MKCTSHTRTFTYTGKAGTAELTENTVVVGMSGICKEHIFIQISDLHITDHTETDTAEDTALAKHEAEFWGSQSIPVFQNGVEKHSALSASKLVIERINELYSEAVFICGDISDIGTKSSYKKAKEIVSEINAPVFLTPGNHEILSEGTPGDVAKAFVELYGTVLPVDIFRAGEIKIIRLDSSRASFTDEQREAVEKELNTGEPAVVFTHIPFFTEKLLSVTGPAWAEYYLLGSPGHDTETVRFAEMICEKAPLVIAGHTHTVLDYPDDEQLQLISAPAFTGFYRIIKLVPQE